MNSDGVGGLVTLYGQSLTRLCLKLCRNAVEAEDLYQETWCKVVAKLHLYDESRPFEPWLLAVCVNTYKNIYKRNRARPVAEFDVADVADTGAFYDEEHRLLRQIIAEMDVNYRIVIVLYYFKDCSVAELASIIRVPQGTVKSRLHKARELIRRRLEEHEG